MKLYHKINDYLLYNYPNIWVTRIHLFLPIGLIILLSVFCVNVFIFPYNIEEKLTRGEEGFWLMVIPVLIYLVYWFVFQARYNVEKSGGKLSLFQEYLNYFSYFAVYSIALLLVMSIPISSEYKVMNSISNSEYQYDVDALNKGNEVVNRVGTLTKKGELFQFQTSNYIYDYRAYNYNKAYQKVEVNEYELKEIINNYKTTFNKYTKEKLTFSAQEIIEKNLLGNKYGEYENDYYNRYPYNNSPRYKLEEIGRLKNKGFLFNDKEALQALSMLIALCALTTWIFKQLHWKDFVFGVIAIALTPLFVGVIALILYSTFRFEEETGLWLIILAYVTTITIVIKGLAEKSQRRMTIITTIYLHFFLPILPIFIYALYDNRVGYSSLDTIFTIGWIVGLLSIGIFKIIYKRYRFLPANK